MKRASTGVLLLLTGFSLRVGAQELSFHPESGGSLGKNIRVLSRVECQDLKAKEAPEQNNAQNPDQADDESNTASSPVKQSDVDENSLKQPGFLLGLFNFKPDGSANRIRTDECSADHLQDLMLKQSTVGYQANVIENFFDTCHTTVKRQGDGDLGSLLKVTATRYNACANPRVHGVSLTMPDGTILRGLLGIQDSKTPRPLVIFKEGAFGNANAGSSLQALMMYFDQGPFHVLTIGNATGSDFLTDNKHVAIGGFDEGMLLVEVAKLMRNSDLASRISEVQIVGISLGGEAALYASYYNQFQPKINGRAPVSSVFAMSPVVNLEHSMDSLFSSNTKWTLIRKFILSDFFRVLGNIPGLKPVLDELDHVAEGSDVPEIIADGAVQYYSKVSPTWGLPPFQGFRLTTAKELWRQNDFLAATALDVKTPTMVLTAESDWIVDPKQNSFVLKSALEKAGGHANIKVVTLDRGNHCAFGPSLGWDLYSSFMMGWEISHSPSLLEKRHVESAEISDKDVKKLRTLNDDEMTVDYHFAFSEKKDYMKITLDQIDDEHADDDFCDLDPEQLGPDCLKRNVVKIPIDELPSWARKPVNSTDAEALTRWANTNVRLISDDGTPVGLNNKNPASFRWISYE